MNTQDLHEICETLSRELGDANEKVRQSGGKLSGSDLDYIDKLTHALKSVKTTLAMVEAEEDGYSSMYPYSYNNSYDGNGNMNGSSYARGRGSNAKRDSMGRYSSRGYSRRYGYSMDDNMIAELQELMNEAPDDRTRQEFQKFINKIQSM